MPKLPTKPWWRASHKAWYVTYRGEQIQLAKGKENRQAARRALADLLAKGKPRVKGDLTTLRQLMNLWLDRSAKTNQPVTVEGHRWVTGNFCDYVGDSVPAIEVTENHVAGWIAARKWQRGTRSQNVSVIRAAFNYGVRSRIVEFNPCAGLSYGSPPARMLMMTKAQSDRLIEYARTACTKQLHELLIVLHATGMRPSEAYRLEAGWISLDFSVATFPKHKTSGTTRRARKVYFPESIQPLLRDLATRNPMGPMLRNRKGNPWSTRNTQSRMRWARMRLGFGPECCLESLRHQWITDALENGVPIATVAELCGNSVAVIVKHYSKLASRVDHLSTASNTVRPRNT